jgi:hypothetical protein
MILLKKTDHSLKRCSPYLCFTVSVFAFMLVLYALLSVDLRKYAVSTVGLPYALFMVLYTLL